MMELALHDDGEKGILQKDIAVNQDVSVKYLDHIIADLKAAGLIINAGGKKSGYRLNRPAGEISIYDVYIAFEDELSIIDCLRAGGMCPREKLCSLRDYWCELNESIRESMESMNLEKLMKDQLSKLNI
jgi:Rrf2 family protein